MDKIWFRKEAEDWNEALPIGNGSLGAMVFGKTGLERIQINEDSVWSGGFMNRINPDAKEHYKTVRKLLLSGKIQEAELLAERCMYATYPHMRHYQSLADVWIRFFKQQGKKVVKKTQGELLSIEYLGSNVSDYKRELDLERSLGRVEYTIDGNSYQREFFASYPEQALVYKMEALEDAFLDFEISVTRKDNRSGKGSSYCDGVEVLDDQFIRLYGTQGGNTGIGFEFLLKIKTEGGACYPMGSHLIVEGAKTAVIYMTARTTFRDENPLLWCQQRLQNMEDQTYEEIKERHIKDYQGYDQSSKLTLETHNFLEDLPTPERLERLRQGQEDIGLLNIYYHFARYLLISSSREGSLPSNLQGIWNEDFEPAWGSKYTININTEMNYWLAEKTGLSRLHMPLLEHLKRMHPHGKEVAREMYGIDGFCCHHNTDIWGDCAPQDNHVSSTLWPMGGAWLCLHILEHYQYTKDKKFMDSYYGIVEDCVRFFLEYLIQDKDGYWISGPSSSPENIYLNDQNECGCLCMGASMDTEIIRELFEGYLKVTRECAYSDELTELVKTRLEGLTPLQIGKHGQIQEWSQDYDEVEPGHRHISQLFALYPASQIRMDRTPELAKAAKKTIERRLSYGGGHTGWSKAWIILFYTRLWDAENAWKNINELLAHATLDNLFDNHPPFQIDGNFGGACGLLEMMVQDYEDCVYLLPALPKQLGNGSVTGIHLKAGATLSFDWKEGIIHEISVTADRNCSFQLIDSFGDSRSVTLEKGQHVFFNNEKVKRNTSRESEDQQ